LSKSAPNDIRKNGVSNGAMSSSETSMQEES